MAALNEQITTERYIISVEAQVSSAEKILNEFEARVREQAEKVGGYIQQMTSGLESLSRIVVQPPNFDAFNRSLDAQVARVSDFVSRINSLLSSITTAPNVEVYAVRRGKKGQFESLRRVGGAPDVGGDVPETPTVPPVGGGGGPRNRPGFTPPSAFWPSVFVMADVEPVVGIPVAMPSFMFQTPPQVTPSLMPYSGVGTPSVVNLAGPSGTIRFGPGAPGFTILPPGTPVPPPPGAPGGGGGGFGGFWGPGGDPMTGGGGGFFFGGGPMTGGGRSGWGILDRLGRVTQYMALWAVLRTGVDIVKDLVDNMNALNDAMVQFQVVTGESREEAERYLKVAQDIGRETGIVGTELMPALAATRRVGLDQSVALYTAQMRRAFGIEPGSAFDEYLSLMRAFPQNDPREFGDVFTRMFRLSGFMNVNRAWSLYGSAAPIASQFGLDLQQYATILAAMGRGQAGRDPGVIERTLRRFIDIYERPETRWRVEEAIGRPVLRYEDGREVRENLYAILRDIARLPVEKQVAIAESFPAQLGQPYSTILVPFFKGLKELGDQSITTANSVGQLGEAASTAMNTMSGAVDNLKSAIQERISLQGGGGGQIPNIVNWLASLVRRTNAGIAAANEEIKNITEFAKERNLRLFDDPISNLIQRLTGGKLTGLPAFHMGMEVEVLRNALARAGAYDDYLQWLSARQRQGGGRIDPRTTVIPYVLPTPELSQPAGPTIRGLRDVRFIQEIPGISPEQLRNLILAAQRNLEMPITGPEGVQYRIVTETERMAIAIRDASGKVVSAFELVGVSSEALALGLQYAAAAASHVTPLNLPRQVTPTAEGVRALQMDIYRRWSEYESQGMDPGVWATFNVRNPYTGVGGFQVTGPRNVVLEAFNVMVDKAIAAMDRFSSSLNQLASEIGSLIESKLFRPSEVTELQFAESRLGMYPGEADETMRRLRATINALNEGRGRDKFEPYMWKIINDPRWAQFFPGGLLQPGGRAVRPGDVEYDLRMVGLAKAEKAYYSGAIPRTQEEWEAIARSVDEWVAAKKGREAMLKQAQQILPGLVSPESLPYVKAWIAAQQQAPAVSVLLGGATIEEVASQARDIGEPMAKGLVEGYTDYVKDRNMPRELGSIWHEQASRPENTKYVFDAGASIGERLMSGVLFGISKTDVIQRVADMVLAQLARGLGEEGGNGGSGRHR